ncbi:MAG: hypothetical protein Q9160_002337 [Pyrenula sp. 1 TL-2023]
MPILFPLALLITSFTLGSANPVELRDTGSNELTVIGDSWAAGSGAGGLAKGWPPQPPCDQDPGSYGQRLIKDKNLKLSRLNIQACAGYTAEQVLKCEVGGDSASPDPQCKNLFHDWLGHPEHLVVQMGMDSIDVEGLIKACVFFENDDSGCPNAMKKSHGLIDSLAKSQSILKTLKTAIQKTGVNPTKVFVPNYISFFNVDKEKCVLPGPQSAIFDLQSPFGSTLNQQRRKDINDIITHLNSVIAHDAEAAGAMLLPVDRRGGPFDTHRFCDDNLPYFTTFVNSDDARLWLGEDNLYIGRLWRPNPDGYDIYKNEILAAIGRAG